MHCEILSNFFRNLPNKPYCSNDLQYGLEILPKNYVTEKKYVQFNAPGMTRYICLDIDSDVFEKLDMAVAPQPNIITLNKTTRSGESGVRGHLLYELHTPVNTGINGRASPQRLLKSVRNGLTELLGGDTGYQHFITKNPLCSQFRGIPVHNQKWELLELLDWIPDQVAKPFQARAQDNSMGRNSALFRSSRHFAYSIVDAFRQKGQRDGFDNEVLKYALSANENLSAPLPINEIRGLAKSVSKWCWSSYDPSQPRQLGILTPEQKQLSGKERQSIGASHTNAQKREKTRDKLTKAIVLIKKSGKHPTQQRVSDHSGLSLRTVKRYWNELVD